MLKFQKPFRMRLCVQTGWGPGTAPHCAKHKHRRIANESNNQSLLLHTYVGGAVTGWWARKRIDFSKLLKPVLEGGLQRPSLPAQPFPTLREKQERSAPRELRQSQRPSDEVGR